MHVSSADTSADSNGDKLTRKKQKSEGGREERELLATLQKCEDKLRHSPPDELLTGMIILGKMGL